MKHFPIYLVSILLCFQFSCNPFAPGFDEDGLTNLNLLGDPTTIDGYFLLFQNAYELRDTSIYGRLFSENFTFTYFDFELGQEISWDRATELNTNFNLFQAVQQINLDWNFYNVLEVNAQEDSAFVIRNFNLSVIENEQNAFSGSGRAKLSLARNGPNLPWQAYAWFDDSDF